MKKILLFVVDLLTKIKQSLMNNGDLASENSDIQLLNLTLLLISSAFDAMSISNF